MMNKLRSSDISPLGRFDMPDFKTIGVGALVILAPVTVVEASYIFAGPDSLESDGGPSEDWLVEASFGSEQLADGIDYVNDGQTLTVEMHTDAIDDSEDLNIVGVRVTLTYSED